MLETLWDFLKRPVSGYVKPTPAEDLPWYLITHSYENIQPGVPLRMSYFNRTMNNQISIVPNGNGQRQV